MPEHHSNTPADALAHTASLFIELGAVVIGLSILARIALRLGLTPIPFYLIAGVFFGIGGLSELKVSNEFISVSAEIGVILLLFMLGLEYTGSELSGSLKRGLRSGVLDAVLNFTPGFALGWILGWGFVGALLLGGVTWVTASSIVSKVLGDLNRLGNRETSSILSVLVLEDLAMAVYLPLVAVLLLGQNFLQGAVAVGIALFTVSVVLALALKFGDKISAAVSHVSSEVVLLSIFGLVLLVAGIAQKLQVSAAIGAFLVGLALSGAVADRAHELLGPLRDLFAATFFFFVGLGIDPAKLPNALPIALGLAIVTAGSKIVTGWIAAKWEGVGERGRMRAGLSLVSRGEFSVVIAGLGATAEPRLAPLAAAYVLILAVAGPIITRYSDAFSDALERWRERGAPVIVPAVSSEASEG
jgi:CPA2 family monovalent cation:H+ antiporter-2